MDYIDGGCLTDVLNHFPKVRMGEAEVAFVCSQVFNFINSIFKNSGIYVVLRS